MKGESVTGKNKLMLQSISYLHTYIGLYTIFIEDKFMFSQEASSTKMIYMHQKRHNMSITSMNNVKQNRHKKEQVTSQLRRKGDNSVSCFPTFSSQQNAQPACSEGFMRRSHKILMFIICDGISDSELLKHNCCCLLLKTWLDVHYLFTILQQ